MDQDVMRERPTTPTATHISSTPFATPNRLSMDVQTFDAARRSVAAKSTNAEDDAAAGDAGGANGNDTHAAAWTVQGVRIGGRAFPVDTVWNVELPAMPADFSVDVELSNGMSVVMPHTETHSDGRWFLVAKDGVHQRQLVARFQRHVPPPLREQLLRRIGSAQAADASGVVALAIAAFLALAPTDVHDATVARKRGGYSVVSTALGGAAGGSGGGVFGSAGDHAPIGERTVPSALRVLLLDIAHGDSTALLRALLLLALLVTLMARILKRWAEAFPPCSPYSLSIAPRAAGLDFGGSGSGGPVGGSIEGGGDSPIRGMTAAFQAAMCAPRTPSPLATASASASASANASANASVGNSPNIIATAGAPAPENGTDGGSGGGSGGNGASSRGRSPVAEDAAASSATADSPAARPVASGQTPQSQQPHPELLVGPLLHAIQTSLKVGEIFGPLMMLAIRNDEGNLRKAHIAWEKHSGEDPDGVSTLRGLLSAEVAAGIHRRGAILCDPSAAMGLLWIRRTMQFFGCCLAGVIETPPRTMGEVGAAAYKAELEPFHGWLLKPTFHMALSGFPHRDEILQRLGSHLPIDGRERMLFAEVAECVETLRKVIDAMIALFEELDLEDTRKV